MIWAKCLIYDDTGASYSAGTTRRSHTPRWTMIQISSAQHTWRRRAVDHNGNEPNAGINNQQRLVEMCTFRSSTWKVCLYFQDAQTRLVGRLGLIQCSRQLLVLTSGAVVVLVGRATGVVAPGKSHSRSSHSGREVSLPGVPVDQLAINIESCGVQR